MSTNIKCKTKINFKIKMTTYTIQYTTFLITKYSECKQPQ